MTLKNQLIVTGVVEALAINGSPVERISFNLDGPKDDAHQGFTRLLSGHDGAYIRTSGRIKGDEVFNWRSWTGLSAEEIGTVARAIGYKIPVGVLLENLVVSGIPDFTQLAPTSRLVFPQGADGTQAILAVWEENGPCRTVGERLETLHQKPGLKTDFIRAAQGMRGVMGFVLSAGMISVGDEVRIYPPVM
jgi:hypothetical protein